MKKLLTTIFAVTLFMACEEETVSLAAEVGIEPVYEIHVDHFISEGQLRLKTLKKEGLTIQTVAHKTLPQDCESKHRYSFSTDKVIQISDSVKAENLETHVFKELAHVLLSKPYSEELQKVVEDNEGNHFTVIDPMYKCHTATATMSTGNFRKATLDDLFR